MTEDQVLAAFTSAEPARLAVVVGRFQVPELHPGHLHLLRTAKEECGKLLVLIGESVGPRDRRNPLPAWIRAKMFDTDLVDITRIVMDCPGDDQKWSEVIDSLIEESIRTYKDLTGRMPVLYHSRDSFASHYKGKYSLCEIQELPGYSGTLVRGDDRLIQDTADFRRGFIYAVNGGYAK